MSLIHWWPLNGDTKDYGVGNATVTASGTVTFDNNGKIGKCLNGGTLIMPATATSEVFNKDAVSIAFWLYNGSDGGSGACIFGTDGMTAPNNRRFSLFQYKTSNDLHWSWQNENSNSPFTSGIVNGIITPNTWSHICAVWNGTRAIMYVNGIQVGSSGGTCTSTNWAYDTVIARASSTRKYNDIRIYNHALSLKEVREISKGLMLHYNFENYYQTSSRNVYASTNIIKGNFPSTSSFVKSGPFIDETGDTYYTYKLNYTGTGSNFWPMIRGTHFAFTIDKRYYYSCDIRIRNANFNIYLRAAKYDNDWVAASVGAISSSEADNTWRRKEVSTIIPETFVRSGETLTSNPQLEFCSDSLSESGKVYTCEFDIKNVQVTQSDYSVPFVDGNAENIISDNSGYGYNSTITGNVTLSNNTATGNYSAYSPSGANYVQRQDNTFLCFNSTQTFTINTWIKINSYVGTDWNTIFRLASTNTTDQQLHWCYKSNGQIILSQYGDDKYYNFNITGQWCMLTWTHYKDGNIAKCKFYVNGVQVGNEQSYSGLLNIQSNPRLALFYDSLRSAYGSDLYMSDFKIYSTALSDSDIKAEYNCKASIDKQGNLYTGLFEQNTTNIALPTKTGIVKANHYVEGGNKTSLQESYTELEYIDNVNPAAGATSEHNRCVISSVQYDRIESRVKVTGSGSSGGIMISQYTGSWWKSWQGQGTSTVTMIPASLTENTWTDVTYICNNTYTGFRTSGWSDATNYWTPQNLKYEYIKTYKGTELTGHFIPAKRKSDNTLGLYDIVNKQFYTNQGTGTFTAGPELNKLNVIYTNELKEI